MTAMHPEGPSLHEFEVLKPGELPLDQLMEEVRETVELAAKHDFNSERGKGALEQARGELDLIAGDLWARVIHERQILGALTPDTERWRDDGYQYAVILDHRPAKRWFAPPDRFSPDQPPEIKIERTARRPRQFVESA